MILSIISISYVLSILSPFQVVDDLLIMLSYLIKAPALPRPSNTPSWLPSQISILGRTASSALLMSPSSARSASSSGSRGTGPGGRKNNNSAQNSVRSGGSGGSAGLVPSHVAGGSGSGHSSAQNSYRSYRVGSIGSNRRHSKGDPTTPSSARSLGAGASGPPVGRHVQVDDTAVMEFSMGETTTNASSPRLP